MRGYAAFLVCGLCVVLNVLVYIPARTFEQAESTEFTVTLALLAAFLVSSITALILTVKNRRDVGLIALLVLSIAFVTLTYYSGSFRLHARRIVDLTYAIAVLGVAAIRLMTLRRFTA